jgi:hypothetical protein
MSKATIRTKFGHMYLLALLLIATLLTGCSPEVEKSEFAGPDWSRGVKVGTSSINNRPGIVWEPNAGGALIVWLFQDSTGWHFQFARLDGQGSVSASRTLSFSMRFPTRAQFIRDSQGGLHLFWLDSVGGTQPGLYHARISAESEILAEAQRLTDPASDVSGYTVAEVVPGALDIFASDVSSGTPLLYHARLGSSGGFLIEPHSLGLAGSNPSSAVDSHRIAHLTWNLRQGLAAEQIMYAAFDSQTNEVGNPVALATFPLGTGLSLYAPEVGLETGRVYVFWALEQRGGGLSPGTAQTHYRTFPTGHPEQATGGALALPPLARPDYETATGAFNYQALFYVTDPASGEPIPFRSAEYTYMHSAISGQRDEVGLFVSSDMALPKRQEKSQIALVVFADGRPKGYEVAGRQVSGSLRPIGVADDEGAIHLAWLSVGGFGNYDIYYATTAPSVRNALNRVTWEDIGAAVMGRTWSTATALSFFPIAIMWFLLPFAWLVGFYLFRPDSDLTTRAGRVALGVAIALYMFSKMFILPAFLWYAPFLDMISPRFELVVLLGVPAVVLSLAVLAMWAYIRRSDRKVVLFAFAIFAGIDAVLSLILYIPNAIGG